MNRSLLLLAFVALASPAVVLAASESVAAAVAKGDTLDQQFKTGESLAAYLEAEKLGGDDAELLRKIAREYALSMTDVPTGAEKKALGQKALDYAKRAVATDPQNATAHLALAICYGRLAPLLDSKTKIAYSKLVKEQTEKSIALDATDDYAYHVLGAWNYEMASLNPILRALARVIYGELPPASYEEAVIDFQKAIHLAPERLAHHVELGRTYAAMGKAEQARAELQRGLAMPVREKDDPDSKERAREALRKL